MSINVHCNLAALKQTTTKETKFIMGEGVRSLRGSDECSPALKRLIEIEIERFHEYLATCEDRFYAAEDFVDYFNLITGVLYREDLTLDAY